MHRCSSFLLAALLASLSACYEDVPLYFGPSPPCAGGGHVCLLPARPGAPAAGRGGRGRGHPLPVRGGNAGATTRNGGGRRRGA